MLTIDEIKNISFRKASFSGGYKAEDVDAFIEEVIASFEQLKKEKTNLVHKIDRLATRLEEYRADEETVRNALLTSQKMSDACIKEAREKAAKIVRDAEEKAQALLVEANNMTALEKENYLQLQADAVNLRAELRLSRRSTRSTPPSPLRSLPYSSLLMRSLPIPRSSPCIPRLPTRMTATPRKRSTPLPLPLKSSPSRSSDREPRDPRDSSLPESPSRFSSSSSRRRATTALR